MVRNEMKSTSKCFSLNLHYLYKKKPDTLNLLYQAIDFFLVEMRRVELRSTYPLHRPLQFSKYLNFMAYQYLQTLHH